MSGELVIIESGVHMTVQDEGRRGLVRFAVSPSGAADRPAYRLANRMVGNRAGAAALEITLGAARLRAEGDLVLAVTGAPVSILVGGRGVAMGEAFRAQAGSVVELGLAATGLRTYLAVRGGVDVAAVLGSRSTDTLGQIGPRPLGQGDRLPVGDEVEGLPAPDQVPTHPIEARPVLDLHPGPRLDWMKPTSATVLTTSVFTVSDRLDRVGVRLAGVRLERAVQRELPSEPLLFGAVQLPPDGEPIIFGPDHPTTGGYPVIGVVAERHLGVVAQLRPGQEVRFRWLR